MSTSVADIEELALRLSTADRGRLASRLIRSLSPSVVDPDDDGAAEAERRDLEMERDPGRGMSLEELDLLVSKRRGR